MRATLECAVSGCGDMGAISYESQFISLRGEVQAPLVHLSATEIPLGVCYVGVPIRRTVQLHNLSNLSTHFKWERPLGEPSMFTLDFDEWSGTLGEKQTAEVGITFTPRTTGVLSECYACWIYGMSKPVGFELTASVKGLVVSYEQLSDDKAVPEPLGDPADPQYTGSEALPGVDPPPRFEFGDEVPLFERRSLRFVIRNLSAIAAPFTLVPSRFKVDTHPLYATEYMGLPDTLG